MIWLTAALAGYLTVELIDHHITKRLSAARAEHIAALRRLNDTQANLIVALHQGIEIRDEQVLLLQRRVNP